MNSNLKVLNKLCSFPEKIEISNDKLIVTYYHQPNFQKMINDLASNNFKSNELHIEYTFKNIDCARIIFDNQITYICISRSWNVVIPLFGLIVEDSPQKLFAIKAQFTHPDTIVGLMYLGNDEDDEDDEDWNNQDQSYHQLYKRTLDFYLASESPLRNITFENYELLDKYNNNLNILICLMRLVTSGLIGGKNMWSSFLTENLYDPRLLILISQLAC